MLNDPNYTLIPCFFFSIIIAFPLVNFITKKERKQYKARQPILSIHCLLHQFICFWMIVISSLINYDESEPVSMNGVYFECHAKNQIEFLNKDIILNQIILAIFTASKNCQILFFIFRCFRLTCAYNIKWSEENILTRFFVYERNLLRAGYLFWIINSIFIYFFPYMSPFSFWAIKDSGQAFKDVFSILFNLYFTSCALVLMYCLKLIKLTDQRFKIQYDLYMIISCFIGTNLICFFQKFAPCMIEAKYYFLRINVYFWIILLLDIWVVLAVGYVVIFVDFKYEIEYLVYPSALEIEDLNTFMQYNCSIDLKSIFESFLKQLESNYSSFVSNYSEQNSSYPKACTIFQLYLDILHTKQNIIQEQNQLEQNQSQIQQQNADIYQQNLQQNQIQTISDPLKEFQSKIQEYFENEQSDSYLGIIYNINSLRMSQSGQSERSQTNQNITIYQIIRKTDAYMGAFFYQFKQTRSFDYIKQKLNNHNIIIRRLDLFKLISLDEF